MIRGPLCEHRRARDNVERIDDGVNDGWFPPRDRVHLMTRARRRLSLSFSLCVSLSSVLSCSLAPPRGAAPFSPDPAGEALKRDKDIRASKD